MFRLRLKELREIKGISQKQLAIMLNMSRGSVGNWESGTREPNLDTIKNLALLFNVTTDYLLGIEDKTNNQTFSTNRINSAIIEEITDLSDAEKEEVLSFIKFKKERK